MYYYNLYAEDGTLLGTLISYDQYKESETCKQLTYEEYTHLQEEYKKANE